MDSLDVARRPRFCWWPGTPVTHPQLDAGQDHSPGDHTSRDRAQDQQEKDRADEDEHNSQRTSHIWWRAHQGDGVFRLPGKRGWPTGRHRPRRHTHNLQGKAAFVMLKNIWTSGGISVRTKLLMSSSSSTPMWSQSCSTDVRYGGQHRRCNRRSRHSSAPILDAFTKSNGKGRCEMKICGRERDWNCCRDCLYRIDWLDRSRLFQKTIDSCIGFSTHLTTCVVAVDLESNRRFLI